MTPQDKATLEDIRDFTREVLTNTIGPPGTQVALLDTPRHRNLGDSLIWLGELDYFDNLGLHVSYHSDLGRYNLSEVKDAGEDAVILLHGGGNLGDIYPLHEALRHRVVSDLPDRQIVVLPQTFHFRDPEKLAIAQKAYSKASDLTFLARDRTSLRLLQDNFPSNKVEYCPDLALGANISANVSPGHELLVLDRTDGERLDHDHIAGSGDWAWTMPNHFAYAAHIAIGALHRRLPASTQKLTASQNQRSNARILELNVTAALKQFSSAGFVATNRLHAHILATLLGIPNAVVDNNYGKISRIFDEYTGAFTTGTMVSDLPTAVDMGRRRLGK